MTCEEAQQQILAADNLSTPSQFTPDLRAHLAICPQCQTILSQLLTIEATAQTLPLPPAALHPSPEFLNRIEKISLSRRPVAQVWVRRAVAAAIIIAVGLAAASILTESKPARADEILKELVVWNLQISSNHDAATRTRLYVEKVQQLKQEVDAAKLAPEDRAVADHLLSNAKQLTTIEDPVEESKNFSAIADELLARQKAPSNAPIAHQLEQLRLDIVNHGINHTSDIPQQQPSAPTKPATPSINKPSALFQAAPGIVPQGSFSFIPSYSPLLVKLPASPVFISQPAITLSQPSLSKGGTFATLRSKADGVSDRPGSSYDNANSSPRTPAKATSPVPFSPNSMPAVATASHGSPHTSAPVFNALTPNTSGILSSLSNPLTSAPRGSGNLVTFLADADDMSKTDADDHLTLSAMHDTHATETAKSTSDGDTYSAKLGSLLLPPLGVLTALPDGDGDWDDITPAALPLAHIYQLPLTTNGVSPSVVPEPASLLILFGAAPLLLIRRRRIIKGLPR